ncbi:MAG: MerR family transcriptional regulator [Bacteroidales bacterium]
MANANSDYEQKQFYSIGEVSKIVGTNETTLRFWEKEFNEINPRRSSRGVRFYSNDDLKTIKLIHHLIKEKGLTLDGTRKRLKNNRSKESNTLEILNRLQELRTDLIAIRNGVELIGTKKNSKMQFQLSASKQDCFLPEENETNITNDMEGENTEESSSPSLF